MDAPQSIGICLLRDEDLKINFKNDNPFTTANISMNLLPDAVTFSNIFYR